MFNKWFKLALVAFIGIIISGFALGLISSGSSGGNAHQHGGMSNNMPAASNTVNGSNASQAQFNMLMQRMNQMEMRMNNIMYNGNYNYFPIPYSNNTGMAPGGSQGNPSGGGGMPMM